MSYMRDSDGNRLDAIAVKALLEGLQSSLTAESAAARNADNLTAGTIADARIPASIARDAEVNAAIGAAIDGLIGGAPGALDTLNELAAALNDDAAFSATVTAAIAANTSAINAEATARANADTALAGTVTAEATTRATADTTLQTNITAEAGTRAAADTALAGTVTSEATTRGNADTALAASIAAEAALARNGDNITSGTVADVRIASTIARDSEVAAAVAAEATARTNADTAVAATVTAETAARTTADAAVVASADRRYLRSPGPAVIGAIGASITNNGSISYYDKVLSGSVAFGYQSPLGTALLRAKGRFAAGGIAATSGYTTAQMISTHLPQVLLSNWDYCIVGEATNDLLNGVTVATTKANLTTIISALVAAGITPILSTTPPNDSNKTGAGLTWLTQLNEWIKAQARTLRLPIVDYHTALVDPASNGYVASPSYTTDGTHPNANGCKVMADALVDTLTAIPSTARSPLQGAYNPNLLVPDCVTTSAGADKMAGSGSTAGGWCYGNGVNSARWKGNAATVYRGSADYLLGWPAVATPMIAGHRIRVSFGIDVPTGPWLGTGSWSAYLWNLTQSQGIAGYSSMQWPVSDGTSIVSDDAAVTSGSNIITCSTRKPFRPNMVGNTVMVVSGVTARFASATTIIGVSADGTQAYCSANANANASAQAVIVLGQPQVPCFEFDVQSDMVGDSFSFIVAVAGTVGTTVSISQVTVTDLTALGAV